MDSITVLGITIEQDSEFPFPDGFSTIYSHEKSRIKVSPEVWLEVERLVTTDRQKLSSAVDQLVHYQRMYGSERASIGTALMEMITRWHFTRMNPNAGPGELIDSITITREGLEVLREKFPVSPVESEPLFRSINDN